jgi:hypothetical protein
MAGTWKLEGTVGGAPAHHTVTAEWILNHQFLRLQEITSADAPATENRYEAFSFIGYDETSERYVVNLLDFSGARSSETLGCGTRKDNPVALVLNTPTARSIPPGGGCPRAVRGNGTSSRNKGGKWTTFEDSTLTRATPETQWFI